MPKTKYKPRRRVKKSNKYKKNREKKSVNGLKKFPVKKQQVGGALLKTLNIEFPGSEDLRIWSSRECSIYEMNENTRYNIHGFEYFSLNESDIHISNMILSILEENNQPDDIIYIITKLLNEDYFKKKIEDAIGGKVHKYIILHVLPRSEKGTGKFPRLHVDYDINKNVKDGCIAMCEALYTDGSGLLLPQTDDITAEIQKHDETKLYPLNLWSCTKCKGETLQNDNLSFLGHVLLDKSNYTYVTQGLSYVSYGNGRPLSLYVYNTLKPNGSGYLFNPRETPHCSVNFPDEAASERESVEIRIMVVKE